VLAERDARAAAVPDPVLVCSLDTGAGRGRGFERRAVEDQVSRRVRTEHSGAGAKHRQVDVGEGDGVAGPWVPGRPVWILSELSQYRVLARPRLLERRLPELGA